MNSKECRCSNCKWVISCINGFLEECTYEKEDFGLNENKKNSICISLVDKEGNPTPFLKTLKEVVNMEENKKMTISECQVETMKHIENVRKHIRTFVDKLTTRGVEHDRLKMESPEVEIFTEYTPKLAETTYGSEEYHTYLKEMNVALQHHYANYRHHPEHFENGINDMNLVDIVEMFCDWQAATKRHNDGNLLKSIELNAKRFGYDDQLKQIFINTAKMFDEQN